MSAGNTDQWSPSKPPATPLREPTIPLEAPDSPSRDGPDTQMEVEPLSNSGATPDMTSLSPSRNLTTSSSSSSVSRQGSQHLVLELLASFQPVMDQSQVFFDSARGHIVTMRDGEVDVIGIGRGWDPKRIRYEVQKGTSLNSRIWSGTLRNHQKLVYRLEDTLDLLNYLQMGLF